MTHMQMEPLIKKSTDTLVQRFGEETKSSKSCNVQKYAIFLVHIYTEGMHNPVPGRAHFIDKEGRIASLTVNMTVISQIKSSWLDVEKNVWSNGSTFAWTVSNSVLTYLYHCLLSIS